MPTLPECGDAGPPFAVRAIRSYAQDCIETGIDLRSISWPGGGDQCVRGLPQERNSFTGLKHLRTDEGTVDEQCKLTGQFVRAADTQSLGVDDASLTERDAGDLLDFTYQLLEQICTEPGKIEAAKKRCETRRDQARG